MPDPRRPARRLRRTFAPGYCWVPELVTDEASGVRRLSDLVPTEPPALDPNRDRSAEVRQQFREARSGWT